MSIKANMLTVPSSETPVKNWLISYTAFVNASNFLQNGRILLTFNQISEIKHYY